MLGYTLGNDTRDIEQSCVLDVRAGQTVSFDLASGGHWYGHGFSHVQPYPLESGQVVNDRFAVNNIQCPIWMCSTGYALLIDTMAVLDVRLNEDGDGRLHVRCPAVPMAVHVFRAPTLPEAHAALVRHIGWPNPAPAPEVLGDCFFNTWTQFPRCITQERVLAMARRVREHDYPCSTFMIDERWESCVGDLRFSRDFPAPPGMVATLHDMGFDVWLWVTPFVNQEAAVFADLARRRVLVPRRDGTGPAMLRWWGGQAGIVDLTSPDGRAWFRDQLLRLRHQIGADGFKVDGGDFKYQPPPDIADWHAPPGPSGYSDALLAVVEEVVPGRCETRTAWRSQTRHVLWREGGKDSHWGQDNGLQAMVTLALNLSLMGYDIVMPDMVPGRVQTLVSDMPLPTDELLVRWAEASVFMPLVQFSYGPWNYAPATERVVHAYAHVHKALQAYQVEHTRCRTAPLLRPVWYDAPHVAELFTVADQYMLGPDLLVAPVLASGRVARDVVLPPGDWRDAWTGQTHAEGTVASHPAPCPGVPVFVRAHNTRLFAALHAALGHVPRDPVPPGVTTTTYSAGIDRDLNVTG